MASPGLVVREGGGVRRERRRRRDPRRGQPLGRRQRRLRPGAGPRDADDPPGSRLPLATAARTARPSGWSTSRRRGTTAALRGAGASSPNQSACAVPLIADGITFGSIGLSFAETRRSTSSTATASAYADLCAQALARVALTSIRERLLADLEVSGPARGPPQQQLPEGLMIAESPSGRILLANDQPGDDPRLPAQGELHQIAGGEKYQGFDEDGVELRPEDWPLLARRPRRDRPVPGDRAVRRRRQPDLGREAGRTVLDRDGNVIAGVATITDISAQRPPARTAACCRRRGDPELVARLRRDDPAGRGGRRPASPTGSPWTSSTRRGRGASPSPTRTRRRSPSPPSSSSAIRRSRRSPRHGLRPPDGPARRRGERHRRDVRGRRPGRRASRGDPLLDPVLAVRPDPRRRAGPRGDHSWPTSRTGSAGAGRIRREPRRPDRAGDLDVAPYREAVRSKNVLDATLDAVIVFDPVSLRISYVNEGAMDQLGYAAGDLVGAEASTVIDEHDRSASGPDRAAGQRIALARGRRRCRSATATAGSPRRSAVPARRADRRTGRIVVVARDVGDRHGGPGESPPGRIGARPRGRAQRGHPGDRRRHLRLRAGRADQPGEPAAEDLFPDVAEETYADILAQLEDPDGEALRWARSVARSSLRAWPGRSLDRAQHLPGRRATRASATRPARRRS